jgi:hypothetical protein
MNRLEENGREIRWGRERKPQTPSWGYTPSNSVTYGLALSPEQKPSEQINHLKHTAKLS